MYFSYFFFLFFQESICCGYSYEVPHPGTSYEYNNILFHGEIRKISILFSCKKNINTFQLKKAFYLELYVDQLFLLILQT